MPRCRNAELDVNMFPFLSVLCALIGVLMLFVLMVMSSRVIGAPGLLTGGSAGQAAWEERLRQSALSEEQAGELREEIGRLEDRLSECLDEERELHGLHAELSDLLAAKEELAELASNSKQARRLGTDIGRSPRVRMVPDSKRKIGKAPVLVEIDSQGFVVHPDKTEYALHELTQPDSPLARFLKRLHAERDRRYPLLLIRPNGIAAYRQLRAYLQEQFGQTTKLKASSSQAGAMDVGKEPFSHDWLVFEDASEEDTQVAK